MQKLKTKILKDYKEGLGIVLKLYVKTRCTLSHIYLGFYLVYQIYQ